MHLPQFIVIIIIIQDQSANYFLAGFVVSIVTGGTRCRVMGVLPFTPAIKWLERQLMAET